MRQDVEIAQITFYGVAGLESLANHQLRLYHTHRVWYGGANKGLIECDKAHSGLLTILLVSLLQYVKADTMQERSRLNLQLFYLFLHYR